MIKNTLKVLVSITLLTTLSIAQKEALLVGVGDYRGTKNDLGGIDIDVNNMKNLLEKQGFHTTILPNAESMNLATRLNSYSSLTKDDSFVFYYSGHGFHVKDENGDEADGEDEALVLSDGNRNELFIDDALYGYLNAISAKKFIILDSCHSGTAFKNFGDKPKPKSLSNDAVIDGVIKTKAFRPRQSKLSSGEYIVFSASQDNEESLATKNGSLFTNAFVKKFRDDEKLMNLKATITQEIGDYCKKTDSPVHHPKLSASDVSLKYKTAKEIFKTKTAQIEPQKTISISGRKTFKEGELLSFTIDTHAESGYLTIFSIENGKPFIMAQTPNKVKGVLNFQQDFSIKNPIECYKACGNCQKEVSSVYVILSATPLTKDIMKTKGLKIDNHQKPIDFRAFRERTNEAYEPIIARVEFTIY